MATRPPTVEVKSVTKGIRNERFDDVQEYSATLKQPLTEGVNTNAAVKCEGHMTTSNTNKIDLATILTSLTYLTLEAWTVRLSRNVGKHIPKYAS
jgi:hypothetical protein